ncbi:hypothetical protein MalM14_02310 [Gimesia chilikensis]|nr:hypothetical protein MalM14_02310 [Gimesia chilikensis]
MNHSESNLFSSGCVVESMMLTLYRFQLTDGRILEAVLAP